MYLVVQKLAFKLPSTSQLPMVIQESHSLFTTWMAAVPTNTYKPSEPPGTSLSNMIPTSSTRSTVLEPKMWLPTQTQRATASPSTVISSTPKYKALKALSLHTKMQLVAFNCTDRRTSHPYSTSWKGTARSKCMKCHKIISSTQSYWSWPTASSWTCRSPSIKL